MDRLRTPFFVAALALLLLAVLVELGSASVLDAVAGREGSRALARASGAPTPGLGIPYQAFLDGVLLFTVGLMGVSLIVPERVHGRVQGIASLIFSLLVLIGSIVSIFVALALLLLMLGLLLAVPFGTIVYFAVYGSFDRGGAQGTLGLILFLKLAFAVCLVLAHQRFLQNKGLVLLIACSLLVTVVVSFLHGLLPRPFVSILDALGAIIVGIVAAIWSLVFLIGAIVAVVKALRVDRALATE